LIHLADFRDDMVPLDVVTPLEKLGTQLSAAIQRVRAEGELRQAKAELENRVTERTLELIRKNDRLHREMEERKQVEQELAKAQHLASLGTLAAGIAHEINNPLHAIAMSAEVTGQALMMPGNEQTAKTFLQKIKDEVARCGRIVRSVLQFARQESSDKWPHQLDKVVNQAVGLVQQQAAERNISVQAELPDRLPLLTMNPTEMEQVLVNLLSNAIMASPPHDHVSVTAEAAADTVCLIVRDKGRGMTEEELQHIFDPFFTTRQQSGGTGLGLSIVHGIVEDHGGTIRVESAFNVGTSFVIELPSTSASEQTDAPHDMPRCPTRSRRQAATQFDPDDTTCS